MQMGGGGGGGGGRGGGGGKEKEGENVHIVPLQYIIYVIACFPNYFPIIHNFSTE